MKYLTIDAVNIQKLFSTILSYKFKCRDFFTKQYNEKCYTNVPKEDLETICFNSVDIEFEPYSTSTQTIIFKVIS